MPPVIECAGVTYRYRDGTVGLANLDLTVAAGEFVVLAGPSGSGKSTLCRLLLGLAPHLHGGALTGRALVDGQAVATTPPAVLSRSAGLVLQNPAAQCVGTTVARDLAFGPACHGLDRAEIERRVAAAAAALSISHLLPRAPHTLSGGEQQRVALAGVLALQPKLVVLDEPYAFLDAAGAGQLTAILRHLHRQGVTIVVAEHRLAHLVDVATRLVVLAGGAVVADGPPAAVLQQDLTPWGLERPDEGTAGGPPPPPPAGGPPAIAWEEVWSERGGRPVLRGASLRVAAGEGVVVQGANGAGKSTLLFHGNGLLRPQRGTVWVRGRPVGRRPVAELAREVGLVVQQPLRMLFAPAVRQEIAAGPRALRREDPAWSAELCERFGLTPLLERVPQQLSAGEQRRVALAAVLASRPAVLLLDEPTAGLDAPARRTLAALLAGGAAGGAALVIATHDTAWASRLGLRRVQLIDGRVEEVTP
jgi:energy-coupling factor transporter ATP-binding protein EcfA2